MAVIKQGGGPNPPVQLDPVQQLVGVSWGVRYLAIRTQINRNYVGAEEFCDTSLGPVPDDHHGVYLVSSEYEYSNNEVNAARIFTGGAWQAISTGAVEVTGMPSMPAGLVSYDAWDRPCQGLSPISESANPSALWELLSGTTLDVVVPDTAGDKFHEALSATIYMIWKTYTDEPLCYHFGLNPPQKRAPLSEGETAFAQTVVSFDAVEATYDGRQYDAVGLHVANSGTSSPSTVTILFEHIKGTS